VWFCARIANVSDRDGYGFLRENYMENSTLQNSFAGASGAGAGAHSPSSMFDLFWNAGPVIKFVIVALLVSSIWSWTIIVSKHFRLKRLLMGADDFEESFWSGISLDKLYLDLKNSVTDPLSNVFCAAMAEWERFRVGAPQHRSNTSGFIEDKIDRAMQIVIRRETDFLERHMGFLSALGINGVTIGLFGTVLGIMNGFDAIAVQQNTSLATVAPIVAEALFATAIGLIAAIPAAIAHNIISTNINRYVNRLETFADEFTSIVSRQFDEI
jgi:biopolymer transport protein TolQ